MTAIMIKNTRTAVHTIGRETATIEMKEATWQSEVHVKPYLSLPHLRSTWWILYYLLHCTYIVNSCVSTGNIVMLAISTIGDSSSVSIKTLEIGLKCFSLLLITHM